MCTFSISQSPYTMHILSPEVIYQDKDNENNELHILYLKQS